MKKCLALTLVLAACHAAAEPAPPFAAGSPWPKFRLDARQTGRTTMKPPASGGALWDFQTGKGIFSSPVVGADGTIYVGSADRYFYALNRDGSLRWKFLTGEIIDSAALLDDRGRVYFGSGDGHHYALDAATGAPIWRFDADPPATNHALINWFEGNVAMDAAGTLYVPNDNFYVYALDRMTGRMLRRLPMHDQTWSSPAIEPASGDIFFGNNNLIAALGPNTYAFDSAGAELWEVKDYNGSVAASPLISQGGEIVVGNFDGFVRAYDGKTGATRWQFGTRDHIYASPAELADGTIVQPSADGTVYALDPATGKQRWAFDTLAPLRSSPAVDGNGKIYFGSGEGRLFVLNPDGTLSWAMRLIESERKDLNSSPALGQDAIYIGGESGQIFSVPYDYCLRAGRGDARCKLGPGEDLPADGAAVMFTSQLGAMLDPPPAAIDGNQVLAFSLFVRKAGDTQLALIDSTSVTVTTTPPLPLTVEVSGDRRFLTVVPEGRFPAGDLTMTVHGQYVIDPDRDGLRFSGGQVGGSFDQSFHFIVRGAPSGPGYAFQVPSVVGQPASVWEMYRLAAPLPSILPSYNQIGFDSLHYLVGVVEGTPGRFVTWVVGAKLAEGENRTVVDPATRALFTMDATYEDGLLSLANEAGFSAEVTGATLAFSEFRLSARIGADGATAETPHLLVSAICGQISFYGPFLRTLGLCNAQTDRLQAYGAALFRQVGVEGAPPGVGSVSFELGAAAVTAHFTGSTLRLADHVLGILLVDADTGRAVSLDYGLKTTRTMTADGSADTVAVEVDRGSLPAQMRAYLMVNTSAAASQTLSR